MPTHALHLDPLPSPRLAPRGRPGPGARLGDGSRLGPRRLRLVAPRPVLARWTWLALVVVLGIAAFVGLDQVRTTVGRAVVEPPSAAGSPGEAVSRPVAPGETLWSIALELRPGDDPRPVVDELARLNGGPAVQAGGSVLVPVDLLVGR